MSSYIRFHSTVFPGDLRKPAVVERLQAACSKLDGPTGIIRRYTPAGMDIDSVVQILTVFASPRLDVEKQSLPEILKPKKSPYGVPGESLFHTSNFRNYKTDIQLCSMQRGILFSPTTSRTIPETAIHIPAMVSRRAKKLAVRFSSDRTSML